MKTSDFLKILCCLLLSVIFTSRTFAQEAPPPERARSWDFTLPLSYVFESTVNGNGGSKVDLNDDLGFGFIGAYHLNNNLSVGGFFNWSYRSYEATRPRESGEIDRYNSSLETTTLGMNVNYYFIPEGGWTPFVSGSLGYSFLDTNIQTGPTDVYCYWDPWWGYICDGYTPTRVESGWSYGLGAGMRVDIGQNISLQLGYYRNWMEIDNASGTPNNDSIRFDFIVRTF